MNEDTAAFYDPEGSSPEALGQVTLFQGDVGSLNPEQRRTFVTLLKRRYISADTHPAEWAELLAAPHVFRTRFNDMYLTLEINTDYQVAYKQQAVSEASVGFPTLLHDAPYNREQTIALIHLREEYFRAISAGQHAAFVQRDELQETIQMYRDLDQTNQVKATRQVENAIIHLRDKVNVLLAVKDDPGRYRISPIIEVLMPVSQMRALLAWIKNPGAQVPDGFIGPEDADIDGGARSE